MSQIRSSSVLRSSLACPFFAFPFFAFSVQLEQPQMKWRVSSSLARRSALVEP